MSAAGTIRLTVNRKDAERVGLLTVRRAKRLPLDHTPLRDLPAAGNKLLKAARRVRDGGDEIRVWTMLRGEAAALFHYLALFFHTSISTERELTSAEIASVRRVSLSIAELLLAKPGPKQQSRDDAGYVYALHKQRATLPLRVIPPDPAYAARMGKRIERIEQFEAQKLNELPVYLQILIIKKYP